MSTDLLSAHATSIRGVTGRILTGRTNVVAKINGYTLISKGDATTFVASVEVIDDFACEHAASFTVELPIGKKMFTWRRLKIGPIVNGMMTLPLNTEPERLERNDQSV